MDYNFDELPPRDRYALLTAVVVPRPIAFVTTIDTAGNINAAPFSFFNAMGSDPAIVMLGIGDREPGVPKDTAANILATGEFVVNVVTEAIVEPMNLAATDFPAGMSELAHVGLKTTPSLRVKPPRIAESPVNMECRFLDRLEYGRNRVIVGKVLHLHVRDELLDDRKRIKPGALDAIGRLQSPGAYSRTRDQFDLERLTYEQFLNRGKS